MTLVPLCCLSSDCPTVIVQHKRWRRRGGDAEKQVAPWLHYLVFDPGNNIMARTQSVSRQRFHGPRGAGLSKRQAVKDIKDGAVQRGFVEVRDFLGHLVTHCSVGLEQEKRTNIHSNAAGFHGNPFIDSCTTQQE